MLTRVEFEPLMEKRFVRFLINICIALIVFSNAEVSRLMGLNMQPLISVVWPATGFSLAALLLYGFKAWPGVFLGNLSYNMIHYHAESQVFYTALLIGLIISLGSLAQALTAAWIMRRYSTRGYFNTVKDMLIFLLPAGALSCMIAATIGVTALYLDESVLPGNYLSTWTAFWIGDTMGVYIFTPLIVVWSLYKIRVALLDASYQACLMGAVFVLLSWFNFAMGSAFKFLYIPFVLWVTYRLLLHASTVFIAMIFLSTIIYAFKGHVFSTDVIVGDQLQSIILFLGVLVATSLVFAGIIGEREAVVQILQRQNIDLRQSVEIHAKELKAIEHEASIQGTISSLGFLTSRIARQLQIPLKAMENYVKGSQDCLNRMKKAVFPRASKMVKEDLNVLDNHLKEMIQFDDQAIRLALLVQEQSALSALGRMQEEVISLHDLLDESLNKIISDYITHHPDFTFSLIKSFDSNVKMVFPLPEDLTPAFVPIFNAALHSLQMKKAQRFESYAPELNVATKEYVDKVEIVIRDNGIGIPRADIKNVFHSFMSFKPLIGTENLVLSLAHDLIVYVHRGSIHVDSVESEFTQITVALPKNK